MLWNGVTNMSTLNTSKPDFFTRHTSKCTNCQKCIVSKENRSIHKAHNVNQKHIRHYQLDGQIFPRGTQSVCDYILLDDTEKKAYLIELKGRNTEDAIPQIEKSERAVKSYLPGYVFFYRIVFSGSGTHRLAKTALARWKEKHGKRNDVVVASYGRSIYEEEI